MKVLSIKCPDCSARMKINDTETRAKCEYCGQVMILKENPSISTNGFDHLKQSGLPFHYAQTHVTNPMSQEELIKRISALIEPISELKRLKETVIAKKAILDDRKDTLAKRISSTGKTKVFIFPLCIGVVILLLSSAGKSAKPEYGIAAFIALLALIPAYIIRAIRLSILKSKINKEETNYQEVLKKIDNLQNTPDLHLIPETYRNTGYIKAILNTLKTHQVNTVQQAINLYEDSAYKSRMEKYHKEQIALQRKILKKTSKKEYVIQQVEDTSSIGRELLKGAAFVAGGAIMGKVLGRKINKKR